MSPARDTATFGGATPLRGRVRVPGDKSLSHRALLFAALAKGRSSLQHLATGDDVRATRHALELLGVRIRSADDGTIGVGGGGFDALHEPDTVLDCRNAGTAMRVLAGLLAGRPFLSVLTGDASLRKRPMARVVTPLRAMGADIDGRADATCAPLVIRGGSLHGIAYELPIASAQVKSALVLAALQADGESSITEPAPTRDHTERMLSALGAPVAVDGRAVRVSGAGSAWDGFAIDVPGDPSSAAFFAVAAAITPGSEIVVERVAVNPTRLGFVHVLRRMGADIDVTTTGEVLGEPIGEIRVAHSALVATTMAGAEIPNVQDEIPVLAIAAAFAEGVTEVRDAEELAVKESNRIGAIQQELMQLGIAVEARRDGLVIRGGVPRGGATLKSHGDHRIAMAAAVAAHALHDTTTVRGWRAVTVSYPEFEEHLGALHGYAMSVGHGVLAIDGPAGAGKSTVARGAADRLGLQVLDTGAMYRAATLACLRAGVDLDDEGACAAVGRAIRIEQDGEQTRVDGVDVSRDIRSTEVTATVSTVSAHPAVRRIMVDHQRQWAAGREGGVVEGRDIGTVVFPDARLKIFLIASDEERARRRLQDEAGAGRDIALDVLRADIERRDRIDSQRAHSPLAAAEDAVRLDTTGRSVDDVVDEIVERYLKATA